MSAPAVLLVEDDPTNQLIALSMLRHVGVEADAASDGLAGVRMATDVRYDVILMDIQMPVMDGVEAMRAIRSRLGPDSPRIVAVTAHATAGTREAMMAAGFDGFYNKPLSIAMLQDAITPPPASSAAPALVARPATAAPDAAAELVSSVRAHVRALLGEDDEAFVVDLAQSFVATARTGADRAAQARDSGDPASIATAAHALKGSAANVGLDDLASSWDVVERGIRSGESAVLDAPLDRALDATRRAVGLLADVGA